MYICLAGKNDIAVGVLEELLRYRQNDSSIRILSLVNNNDDGINGWQKSFRFYCNKYQIPIVELDDVYHLEEMLFLSCEYDRLIDTNKFSSNRLFNVHFSLLPKYKGMYTAVLPILYGEKETGVTLHKIDNGIDTGSIIAQKRIVIEYNDTSYDVYKKNIFHGTFLVKEFLPQLIYRPGDVKSVPQAKEGSTYFSRKIINFQSLKLEVNNTAYCVVKQVLAFAFRPYQLLKFKGIPIVRAKILKTRSFCKPGTILQEDDNMFIIASVDYDVLLYKDRFDDLLEAIVQGKNEKVYSLPLIEVYLNEKNSKGWTPLMVATYNNNKEMFYFLLRMGASIYDLNNNGTNMLMYAKDCFVNTGDSELFESLYRLGLSIYQKDYFGLSLKDYCKKQGISSICRFKI